jgi:hypothetical protein
MAIVYATDFGRVDIRGAQLSSSYAVGLGISILFSYESFVKVFQGPVSYV